MNTDELVVEWRVHDRSHGHPMKVNITFDQVIQNLKGIQISIAQSTENQIHLDQSKLILNWCTFTNSNSSINCNANIKYNAVQKLITFYIQWIYTVQIFRDTFAAVDIESYADFLFKQGHHFTVFECLISHSITISMFTVSLQEIM